MSTAATHANAPAESRRLIAPRWHTVVMFIILSVPVVIGAALQTRAAGAQLLSNHSQAMLRFYVPAIIFEWLLVLYVWFGVRKRGGTVASLIGGTWRGGRKIAIDAGLALLLVVAMAVIGAGLSRALGPDHARQISVLMPETKLEMLLWVGIAMTAGFVEELVYRGYLQTQLAALGLPPVLAIAAQALIFGAGHAYEGRNATIIITVYALIFGGLAAWRKSLRPGMVGHTWFDIVVVLLRPR